MADIKIASLTAKTTWVDTDIIIVEDSSDTKKMTVATLKSLLQPTIMAGFGNLCGSTTAGVTFDGYGHVRCVKIGKIYTFTGECIISTASGPGVSGSDVATGLHIGNIKSILGISAALTPKSAVYNFIQVIKPTGLIYSYPDVSNYGYGLSLQDVNPNILIVGRWYTTSGSFGGWGSSSDIYAINNVWKFEFIMEE